MVDLINDRLRHLELNAVISWIVDSYWHWRAWPAEIHECLVEGCNSDFLIIIELDLLFWWLRLEAW